MYEVDLGVVQKSFKPGGSEAVREKFEDQHFCRTCSSLCDSTWHICILHSFHLANQCYWPGQLKQKGAKRDEERGKKLLAGHLLLQKGICQFSKWTFFPGMLSCVLWTPISSHDGGLLICSSLVPVECSCLWHLQTLKVWWSTSGFCLRLLRFHEPLQLDWMEFKVVSMLALSLSLFLTEPA